MYLHLVGSEQFGKSNFVFAVQETFGTYYLFVYNFQKTSLIHAYVYIGFTSDLCLYGSEEFIH